MGPLGERGGCEYIFGSMVDAIDHKQVSQTDEIEKLVEVSSVECRSALLADVICEFVTAIFFESRYRPWRGAPKLIEHKLTLPTTTFNVEDSRRCSEK